MKQVLKFITIVILTGTLFYVSCKKEYSCENCRDVNKPPIANAGTDQTISLPVNSVDLDGSASLDPDNNITNYVWTKISGPTSFNISNANTIQTPVTNFVEGNYQFELKVTDAGGLFSKDTMQVTVNPAPLPTCHPGNRPLIKAQLVPVGTLSQTRQNVAVASIGNKILFAGGWIDAPGSSRVDIYDLTTNTWSTAELSQGRSGVGVAALGNKIFFAGGTIAVPNTGGGGEWGDDGTRSSRIDIYDASLNSWSIAELSEARSPIGSAAGNKVVFAGNDAFKGGSERVDIYDASINSWATAILSDGRKVALATAVGNKIYFAGGRQYDYLSSSIDIYDAVTNSWIVSSFGQFRDPGGIAVDDKIYWAGGQTSADNNYFSVTNSVEIKEVNTQTSSYACLFQPNAWFKTVVKNNKIVFFTGSGVEKNKFDIYDIVTNTWSIGVLPQNIEGAAIISVNNTIYVAGGYVNRVLSNQVSKLEF